MSSDTKKASFLPADSKLVAVDEALQFICRCMEASGAPSSHAASLAEVLLAGDKRGHYSHGMNRLEMYVREVTSGQCDGKATPTIIKETPGTAYVDGHNAIGTVVGTFCMDLAIKKAKEVGIGWVTCTASNHYGIAGYYSMRAMGQGLIGMSTTNTSPIGVPTRSKEVALGTNPWTFAAPASEGDSFVLDMATTTVALGKVEIQSRKDKPIPHGWAVDSDGKETESPKAMLDGGGLLYLGGAEESGGYKGYGLGMMVDVMGGMLGGGAYAQHVRKWNQADGKIANLGQTFIALDPGNFAPNFPGRMRTFMQEMRHLEPVDPENPVLVAGDPERTHEMKVAADGGIWYHNNLIAALNKLAEKLKVDPIKI